jgi:hypothetical protein
MNAFPLVGSVREDWKHMGWRDHSGWEVLNPLTCRGASSARFCGGLADSFAAAAEPVTNAGWFVLIYAAWMLIKLEVYSDVGPNRSRSSSETTSMI